MKDTELSRLAAAEGMVLLENKNGALPLERGATVALFGEAQINFIKGGTGSGDVNALYNINLLEGMKNKESEGKIVLNEELAAAYTKNASLIPNEEMTKRVAAESKNAIVVISRISGENEDLTPDKFTLSSAENKLLRTVCSAGFEHVTVVLNVGAVMSTSFMDQYDIDALLIAWQPGLEGGNATADVLCGDVNPSGKLADTIAQKYYDYPSSKNFNGSEYAIYTEDIFVGYRYFETFDPEETKVAYTFGYGLSYTSFELSKPAVRDDGVNIEVKVTVTNTGSRAGKEVVQVYYAPPAGRLGAVGRALGGFAKTSLLEPDASETLTVTFSAADMATYDDTGVIAKYAYVLEKGDYGIYAGNSLHDAKARGVCYIHRETDDRVVLQLDGKIAPTTLSERLRADGTMEKLDDTGYATELLPGVTIVSACDYLSQKSHAHFISASGGSVYGVQMTSSKELVFRFAAPEEQDYTLTLTYGRGGSEAYENGLILTVNGKAENLPANPSGGALHPSEGNKVTVHFKKGANDLKIATAKNLSGYILLISLTFDDGSGAPVTDLSVRTPQSTSIASGEKFDFKEVYDDPSKLEAFVDSLTPAEMISLLCQHSANVGKGDGALADLSSRGVPPVDTSDGPAGLDLAVKQVAWPIETSLACTFDTSLLYAVGRAVGSECYEAGVDVWLAPGINIHRDPLGGRNFEYFSEDPLLTGKIASALTQGVQHDGFAGVMIKHLYANSREAGRVNGNSSISERAARMIYLKAFEICVKEASPLSFMTTYNLTNGKYNSENEALLDGVFREEWGFKGFFCTDWGCDAEQAREIAAGNDAKMMHESRDSCLSAYKCGLLPLEKLKASATRILDAARRSGSYERLLHPVIPVHDINGYTRVKAAKLATRSPGVNFEECKDEDGGINPNYLQDGKNVTYNLNVLKAGSYGMSFRVASDNNNPTFRVFLDGKAVGTVRLNGTTGGWQNWTTVDVDWQIDLPEGEHVLKFLFSTAININWFEFKE